jgi:hypothetical protein
MSNRLHLTPKQRRELTDIIVARGDPYCCFYCHYEFKNVKECWLEHLDDDRTHNNPDNIVFTCRRCNAKKLHNESMRVQAREKLRINQMMKYVRDWKELQKLQKEPSEAVAINQSNCDTTVQWLEERLPLGSSNIVLVKEAVDTITFECKDKTGYGSQQSIRNYIDYLTSSAPKAPFEIFKQDNKRYIRRKQHDN